jgi:hypothetical protein
MRYLTEEIGGERDKTVEILDLGIGVGGFGKRIKTRIQAPTRITGVEVWEKYKSDKWAYYDEIVIDEISAFLAGNDRAFDFILLIDVLEHFERAHGEEVLSDLKRRARRAVIVSTPTTDYPQGPFGGNPYEIHRCIWRNRELCEAGFRRIYSARTLTFSLRPPVAKIGVYLFEKPFPDTR